MKGVGTAGELPLVEEQYGTRSLQLRRYTCDHRGVRRVWVPGDQLVWSNVQKFVKVASRPSLVATVYLHASESVFSLRTCLSVYHNSGERPCRG